MLPQDKEDAQVLTGLGLTLVQAEVYLTLARIGRATIKSLSVAVKMDRANVYRIILKLLDLDLVEKIITTPTKYQSVSLHEAIPVLLKQKEEECAVIQFKTKQLLTRRKQATDESPFEESQFLLVPKGSPIIRKLNEMTAKLEKMHYTLFYWSDFKDMVDALGNIWKSILNKGVMIKALVYLQEGEKFSTELLSLKQNELFKIRRMTSPIKSTMSIFDGKEAFVSVDPKIASGSPSLWVSNPNLVAIFQFYFESLWDTSEAL
jgi:sugar-specific transcriptional regulator TrmB